MGPTDPGRLPRSLGLLLVFPEKVVWRPGVGWLAPISLSRVVPPEDTSVLLWCVRVCVSHLVVSDSL